MGKKTQNAAWHGNSLDGGLIGIDTNMAVLHSLFACGKDYREYASE